MFDIRKLAAGLLVSIGFVNYAMAQDPNFCRLCPPCCKPPFEDEALRSIELNICNLNSNLCTKIPELSKTPIIRLDFCVVAPEKCAVKDREQSLHDLRRMIEQLR